MSEQKPEPLSAEEVAEHRVLHYARPCDECPEKEMRCVADGALWPCDTVWFIAAIDARDANLARLNGLLDDCRAALAISERQLLVARRTGDEMQARIAELEDRRSETVAMATHLAEQLKAKEADGVAMRARIKKLEGLRRAIAQCLEAPLADYEAALKPASETATPERK